MAEKDGGSGWSVSEREFGRLEQSLLETRHDLKNLKVSVDASYSLAASFKAETRESLVRLETLSGRLVDLDTLGSEFNTFRARVYTAGSVVVLLAGAVAWLIDVVLRIMPDE